jgi:hypothetical protein
MENRKDLQVQLLLFSRISLIFTQFLAIGKIIRISNSAEFFRASDLDRLHYVAEYAADDSLLMQS